MLGRPEDARRAMMTDSERFTETMPELHMSTPSFVRGLYGNAGLSIERLTGSPSLIYPGYQETQSRESTHSLQGLLGVPDNFEAIYAVEYEAQKDDSVAARGSNIFVVGPR